MTHQQDVEPTAALVATLVAMSEAARHAGGGIRTAGRRAARGGTNLGRRAWENAADSRQRANVALRVYRGERIVSERRPAEYVAAGIVTGMTAAFATLALGRMLLRGSDDGPGTSRAARDRLSTARSTAMRITRRRRAAPVPEPGGAEQPAGAADGVTTIPVTA
jgi:hypothetical protein